MPEEFSRTTARKKIVLPSGDTIYVPVITKISFIDPFNQNQEYEYSIDNTADADRKVHVDSVSPVAVDEDGVPTDETPTADTSSELFVERIETFKVVDPFDQHQESQPTTDNTAGNDQLPPHFSTHAKTHIYRYHQDPQNPDDNGVWVDSELIDRLEFIDPFEQYQERHLILANPTNAEFRDGDLSGQASDDDPDLTIVVGDSEGEGTEDNPVRLDPFQNIVNFSGGYLLRVEFIWSDIIVGHNLRDFVHTFYTVTPVTVTVTVDEATDPSGSLLSNHMITGSIPVVGSGPAAQHTQFFVFDISSLSASGPVTFTFTLTDQQDFTDFTAFTYDPMSVIAGVTELTDAPQFGGGPWPTISAELFSKADYHFDDTNPAIPIQPNNPSDPPGSVLTMQVPTTQLTTKPSTDIFYYVGPYDGSGPVALVSGGTYSVTGLFQSANTSSTSALVLNLQNIETSPGVPRQVAMWPSTPSFRTVDYVPGNPPGSDIVLGAGGLKYRIPNPPPPYGFGTYRNRGPSLYKFGGQPILSNKYTGTYPPA